MRTLRFRVWDTKEKKWLFNPKVAFIHHEKSWGNDFCLEIDEDWVNDDYDPNRYLFVQYTGLKDKNGVEVYEGDIYRHTAVHGYHGSDRDLYVLADLEVFLQDKGLKEGEYNDDYSQIEVVGNIYENPELVEVKKGGTNENSILH